MNTLADFLTNFGVKSFYNDFQTTLLAIYTCGYCSIAIFHP